MNNRNPASRLNSLPLSPGIYIFKDKTGSVLYVGKATKLRQRVRSYFAKTTELTANKQIMVKKIAAIETIITSDDTEALILESVLIKKHQPPYNITLKDDKNYQFIKIDYRLTRPTVTTVRRPELDRGRSQARYFGPYTSGYDLQESLRLLRRIFPYCRKDKDLTKFERELLQKRTLGPLPENAAEYQQMINRLIRVLEGHSEAVIADLQNWMKELSAQKRFEQAARVRDQIRALEIFSSRQKMVSVHGESQDVISLYRQDDLAAVNVFVIRVGKLIDKRNFLLQHTADENDTAILDASLTQYYSEVTDLPKEIIVPIQTSLTPNKIGIIASENSRHPELVSGSGIVSTKIQMPTRRFGGRHDGTNHDHIKITIPSRGKKRDLIKLGEINAHDYLLRSLPAWQVNKHETELKELQTTLNLKKIPARIEGYDISNIQGRYAVGAMVVFTHGEPDKKEYRKFKIKTVRGANDVAMLAEVLKRRFKKADSAERTANRWNNPDLIVLDGGKGQLSTVLNALSALRCPLFANQFIALAKRAEEIFQGKELKPVNLPPTSPGSRLLQRIRDEAHRFSQAYYHARHAQANIKSQLDDITGLGPKTKKLLIQKFGSLAGVRQANKDDIIKLIGKNKTEQLMEQL